MLNEVLLQGLPAAQRLIKRAASAPDRALDPMPRRIALVNVVLLELTSQLLNDLIALSTIFLRSARRSRVPQARGPSRSLNFVRKQRYRCLQTTTPGLSWRYFDPICIP